MSYLMYSNIQFMLAVRWKDIRLISKPLSFPTLPLSQQKSKGVDSNRTDMIVQMMSDSNSIPDSEERPLQVRTYNMFVTINSVQPEKCYVIKK